LRNDFTLPCDSNPHRWGSQLCSSAKKQASLGKEVVFKNILVVTIILVVESGYFGGFFLFPSPFPIYDEFIMAKLNSLLCMGSDKSAQIA